jgi:hypothetical protein
MVRWEFLPTMTRGVRSKLTPLHTPYWIFQEPKGSWSKMRWICWVSGVLMKGSALCEMLLQTSSGSGCAIGRGHLLFGCGVNARVGSDWWKPWTLYIVTCKLLPTLRFTCQQGCDDFGSAGTMPRTKRTVFGQRPREARCSEVLERLMCVARHEPLGIHAFCDEVFGVVDFGSHGRRA